jgi:hypothetical protein
MPDISMCKTDTCPLKEACYRFMVKPNPWRQAYSDFKWSEDNEGKVTCDHYWPIVEL